MESREPVFGGTPCVWPASGGPSRGRGHTYTYFVPKHKSGRNFFVEMLFADGRVVSFGPAVKQ